MTCKKSGNWRTKLLDRPDKGKGVFIVKKSDYIAKMNDQLNDKRKFKRLGAVSEIDHTYSKNRDLEADPTPITTHV